MDRDEVQVPGLDGVIEFDTVAVYAADQDEVMSRAVIFGRASDSLPHQVQAVLDEQQRRREDRSGTEEGWINADEDHLWPISRACPELEDDWIDAEADRPRMALS